MEESVARYETPTCGANDDHQLLYQTPKDKFNYRMIAEFCIKVSKTNHQRLHDFSAHNNKNINYVVMYKILVHEFDQKYLKKLLSHKIAKRHHRFMEDFQDKNEITSFVELLAANFSKQFVKTIFMQKCGEGVPFFNYLCAQDKICCSKVFRMISKLFGQKLLQDIVQAKHIYGNTFLHFLVCWLDDQIELENCLNALIVNKSFFRFIIYTENDTGNHFFSCLSQTNVKNLNFTVLVNFRDRKSVV